ncbi:MAG TPA: DUF4249 domain-containing protein [Puia sp.]|jgi:hypothetical protein
MKRLILSIATLLPALSFYSCQKTVNLDLNTIPPQIVIQGEVTNAAGPYSVTINQSVNFYADNSFPAVSGAIVKISDNQGVTDSLTETTPGTYTTHVLQGKPGNTYTLTVKALQANYSGVSVMPQPVSLDSISFQTAKLFGSNQITAIANFQDPAGVKNYYQFFETINGVPFTKDIFIFSDRLSDGRYINNNLRMDSAYLQRFDELEVRMNCIDVNIYNYFNQLDQSSGGGVFNTTASPANPVSNINNGAYGYFSAHTTQTQKVSVQ